MKPLLDMRKNLFLRPIASERYLCGLCRTRFFDDLAPHGSFFILSLVPHFTMLIQVDKVFDPFPALG